MKTMKMKSILLLALVAVLLIGAVGGTVAYLATSTGPVENVFTPAEYDTDIDEEVDATQKTSITVKNKGEVDVYVRVAIVGYYVDDTTGNIVAEWKESPDYNKTKWTRADDGFYYYNEIVKPGEATENLLANPIAVDTTSHSGAHLVITVVHQSIQAEGLPSSVTSAQDAFALANASTGD
ncbi:MAG: hypothetical protein ACI4O7_01475 [Aristaeellaceae bacterium]